MSRFKCIGPDCEDNCCHGWQVDVDPRTYDRLIKVTALTSAIERKRLKRALQIVKKDRYERRLIRYRVVRLLDAPDELRSVEIGQLDQGDEVQLLEKSGAYWLVRTPDGRQGWLHKMTLGDTVTESATSAAEAWNVGDIDGDVLSAYLAARARA